MPRRMLRAIFQICLIISTQAGMIWCLPESAPAESAKNLPLERWLPAGSRLAIIGDSITELRIYSSYIEAYLLACAGRTDLHILISGLSGEKADSFANRVRHDLHFFQPSVATIFYGMNDGGYRPYDNRIGWSYAINISNVIGQLRRMGTKQFILGSPGVVDSFYFRTSQKWANKIDAPLVYNDTLRYLRDLDEMIAFRQGLVFADIYTPLLSAMTEAKAVLGEKYEVCGLDGIHPQTNGSLVIAYAFLKALGSDGQIADIQVDMAGQARVSPGHQVISYQHGVLEIESRRFPFCFDPSPTDPTSNRSILPFVPFNRDLNQFMLRVLNLASARAKISWGKESREFSQAQLASGINLIEVFAASPFDQAFLDFLAGVRDKEAYEVQMIKQIIRPGCWIDEEFGDDPSMNRIQTDLVARLSARQAEREQKLRQMLVPIRHTIKIEPLP